MLVRRQEVCIHYCLDPNINVVVQYDAERSKVVDRDVGHIEHDHAPIDGPGVVFVADARAGCKEMARPLVRE